MYDGTSLALAHLVFQFGISSILVTLISSRSFIFRLIFELAGYTTSTTSVNDMRISILYPRGVECQKLTDFPQPIRAPKRLVSLQPMPRINPHMILPERPTLVVKAVLLGDPEHGDGLPGVFFRVPDLAGILDGLVVEVLAQLDLEEVFRVVLGMEVLQPVVQDVGAVFGADGFFEEFALRFGGGDEAVFHYVVAVAVRGLRVLPGRLEVGVSDLVASCLELGIVARFEVLVQLFLVTTMSDTKADDLFGRLGICKVESGCAVELNILGREVFAVLEEIAVHVEELNSKATRVRHTIVQAWVTWLGTVTAYCWIGATFGKELTLLQVLW